MNAAQDVTVVVVGYNHAAFVETCLDSIAAQTLQPARVVVMDDASPDRTGDVARTWSSRTGYEVEVCINPRNIGLCATLNAALATVTTPYYAYISADDHMESARLAEQLTVITQAHRHCAAVYSDAYIEDATGTRTGELASEHFGWPQTLNGSQEIYDQMLDHNWIPAPSVLLRTTSVKAIGGYDPDLYFEDLDLYLRLLRAGNSFQCLPIPLVTFRVHSHSLGSSTFDHQNVRFIRALRAILHKQLEGASPKHRTKVEGKLWWLALRGATNGARERGVPRDLFAFRRSAGISHPLRAAAVAMGRGLLIPLSPSQPGRGVGR